MAEKVTPIEQNIILNKKTSRETNIIAIIVALPACLFFLLGVSLLIGFADIPHQDSRPALFGMVWLVSELEFGIYYILISSATMLTVFGIVRKYKWGWWFLIILSVYHIINNFLVLPRFETSITIIAIIKIGIIFWLIYRREFFCK
ncbi:MAG: hypothetical protein K8R02_01800 [Anaerohalosphaeraceae bacterium]|nr:hypothetical protein [Anaerohalosphaeraceae bacterium]